MRRLNRKQKSIIKGYIKHHYFTYSSNSLFDTTLYIEKIGVETNLLEELEKVNDYETLWQDYVRLKGDLIGRTEEEQLKILEEFV